jgi:Protein of unknown function (DUF3383)
MAQIPFSQVVNVVPSVLSAGGSAVDLNAIMLTQNSLAPNGQMLTFSSAANVGAYFGLTSTEYSLAQIYFAGFSTGTKTPGQLMFTRYPETAIGAFLNGASPAALTLTQLQALSGTLIVTSNGTQFTSGTITLSGATSFSNAATIIQTAFTSPTFTVSYSSTTGGFILTSATTGATSTLTFATGTLATSLALTAATGALLSQGAAVANPGAFMAGVTALTQNWATFMTVWESVLAEKEAFAAWSSSVSPRYLYVCADSDVNALTANNTVTFGNYLQANTMVGTCAVFGTVSHAAFVCAWAASLDFTRLNGRATLCFKSQSGLTPYVSNQSNYAAVVSNGYNTYAAFGSNNPANNTNWFTPGSVSGNWLWADSYMNQVWLNANLQLAFVNLLTSVNSIPYNQQGYGLMYAAAMGPIQAGINFGAIRKGVTLSTSQVSQIQYALGFDASSAIVSQGFYLDIANASPTTRAARQSPPCTLYYADGESVQQINLASIVVQ